MSHSNYKECAPNSTCKNAHVSWPLARKGNVPIDPPKCLRQQGQRIPKEPAGEIVAIVSDKEPIKLF